MSRRQAPRAVVYLAPLVALAATSISGCSDRQADATAQPATNTSADDVASTWPVGGEWRFEVPWGNSDTLYSHQFGVWQQGIAVCMADAGFEYAPVDYAPANLIYRLMNPLNLDTVQRYGYEEPPDPLRPSPDATDQPAEFFDALNGASGCGNQSSSYVYGAPLASDFAAQLDVLAPAADRAVSGFASTQEGSELLAEWSDCMNGAGYDFDSPDAARSKYMDGEVTKEELKVRRADYDCDLEVRLTESRSEFESEHFDAWLDDNSLAVSQISELLPRVETELTDLDAALRTNGAAALSSTAASQNEPATASTVVRPDSP